MKWTIGAAFAAVALACSSPASAAIMFATLSGDFNDDPQWESWTLELKYDTDALTAHTTPNGVTYRWNEADGGRAIIFSKLAVQGFTDNLTLAHTSGFSDFSIVRTDSYVWDDGKNYLYYFTVGGMTFNSFGQGTHGLDDSIDKAISGVYAPAYYAYADGVNVGTPHVHHLDVAVSAIPEPSAWAMMIAGFGLAGSAIRVRRRNYLSAL